MPDRGKAEAVGGRSQSDDRLWWRGAAVYQIYPRSFADQNGDGVGDLPGITAHLDYVASLNVDAIWLSPIFTSPMQDFGYDISDYRDIDKIFGTLDDFKRLIRTAHDLGLRVIIDQVLSHSSDQHPWFIESRASTANPKASWYVWADPRPDGTPPNNWLSVFGGSAWQWDSRRRQYYLHNFLKSQPDLNFHVPEVRKAMLDILRFWLELGVDGFRLDTVNFYFHDAALRSNPPVAAGNATTSSAPTNPYLFQAHRYDKTRPENLPFLEEMRRLLEEYGAIAIGELGVEEDVAAHLGQYTAEGRRLQTAYTFQLLTPTLSAAHVRQVCEDMERELGDGWPTWAFSNHDFARVVSRWGFDDVSEAAAPMLLALLGSLRGSICVYQGEELGLTEADVPFEKLQDPYGKEFWPAFKGRDGCRTPMPWQDAALVAGFTSGTPWLPVPPEHLRKAVSIQSKQSTSVLNRVRDFLAWRRTSPALRGGTIEFLDLPEPMLGLVRSAENETVLCAFNLSRGERTVNLGHDCAGFVPIDISRFTATLHGATLTIPALGAFFATQEENLREVRSAG